MVFFSLFPLMIYGLIWGSFLTVVGLRAPMKQPFVFSRSCCPNCQHALSPKELVPLFSMLFQKGKCRHCKHPIALLYPLTEITTAFLLVMNFLWTQPDWIEFTNLFLLLSFGTVFSISDLTTQILPDKIMGLFLTTVFLFQLLAHPETISYYLLCGVGFFSFFYLFYLLFPDSIGGGDVKYYGILGFLLGYQTTVLALLLACSAACIFYFPVYLSNKRSKVQPIPFAPFISLGAYVAFLISPLFFNYLTVFFLF